MNDIESMPKIGWKSAGKVRMVTKSGQIIGPAGEFWRKKRIFPPNSTFMEFNSLLKSVEEALLYHMDYVNELPMLGKLPSNITTGPPYQENSCYLVKARARTHHDVQTFQDSFKIFEFDAGALICIITLILFALMMKSTEKSLKSTAWNGINFFFYGDTGSAPKSVGFRTLLISIIKWVFLIKTIHS